MSEHPTLKRLLEAILVSALAGASAYGLVTWLAPPAASALTVASIIAAVAGLAILVPGFILKTITPPKNPHQTESDPLTLSDWDSASGLPMMGGLAGLDAGGNAFGSCDETEMGDDENLF